MKNKLKIFLCFVCLLISCLFSSAATAETFGAETHTLPNGLQLVVIPGSLSEAVGIMIFYKAGAMDDPKGKSGLAHYLEHLMFKGTEHYPAGAFSRAVANVGGQDNAYTNYDMTVFHELVPASNWRSILKNEASRMRQLVIDENEARTELQVVLSERQQRTDNNPHGRFQELLRKKLFDGHPYGRAVIGWKKEIEKLTPDDVRSFYKKNYAPNNALIVLSGDITSKEAFATVRQFFGEIKKEERKNKEPEVSLSPIHAHFDVEDKQIKQAYGLHMMVAPSYLENKEHALALQVLSDILSHGEIGLLYKKFVLKERQAEYIGASYNGDVRGPALFSFTMIAAQGHSLEELDTKLMRYLKQIEKTGFTKEQTQKAIDRLTAASLYARDGVMGPAKIIGSSLAIGQTIDDVENWPENISHVTAGDVTKALRLLLTSKQNVSGFLFPKKRKRP